MNLPNTDDTIVAIASGAGLSAISIVRMSGPQALAIADGIFRPKGRLHPPSSWPTHSIRYGHVVEGEKQIDEVLLTVMKAPGTYTREDIVEINCHGGLVAARGVLDFLLRKGARLAGPGEFTFRAFLNGRIDLAQAEAANLLIRSLTETSLQMALRQMSGALSDHITSIANDLEALRSRVEAAIDFPEDVEGLDMTSVLVQTRDILSRLIDRAPLGRKISEGLRVVILGRPNAGKSSLLNHLLGEERALVDSEPGTTRDLVHGDVDWSGIRLQVTDTAGIRSEAPGVEAHGIQRALQAIRNADFLLAVFDGSRSWSQEDVTVCQEVSSQKGLTVLNKLDLPQQLDRAELRRGLPGWPLFEVSCFTGQGLPQLIQGLQDKVWSGEVPDPSAEILVQDARHVDVLTRCRDHLDKARDILEQRMPLDLVATELRESHEALGEITGKTAPEAILNAIFSKFCVGK